MKVYRGKYVVILAVLAALLTAALYLVACAAPPSPSVPTLITAPVMVKLSLEELVARAESIVIGVVTEKKSQWNADRTSIYTLVTLSVEQQLKGQSVGANVIIKVAGGKVGETTQQVEDVAGFSVGEKAVLFLQRNNDGTTGVVGGFQGKMTIEGGNVVSSNRSLQDMVSQIKAEVSKSSK